MQKDKETELEGAASSADTIETQGDENASAKKAATRKKTTSTQNATKKPSSSVKKSSTGTKSPTKKTAIAKSDTEKETAEADKKPTARKPRATAAKSGAPKATTAKKSTAKKDEAVTEKVLEEITKEKAEEKLEVIQQTDESADSHPLDESSEKEAADILEDTVPSPENSESDELRFIIPESAEFTLSDTDGKEIFLFPEAEGENGDGLLNVEHFSDYSPKREEPEDADTEYDEADSYEENITILHEEEPSHTEPTDKREKKEDPDKAKYDPKKPRKVDARFDFVELFVFTLLAVILLTTFVFRHAVVDGPSMQNTLQHGEHLIISDLFYTPEKGDVIVFQDRATAHMDPIVKRVIATEGDTVKIVNSVVYVNGERLNELDYVLIDGEVEYSDFPEVTVPEDMLFVLGDHRNNSADSRTFVTTFVREDAVLGRVILRFYPFDRFGKIE